MKYKEKYECGLECIQEILSGAGDSIKTSVLRKRLQPFFPELKESEDERIRKAVIEMIHDTPGIECENYNVSKEDILAWLERQKPVDKEELKKGALKYVARQFMNWLDAKISNDEMCLSNMECKAIEDAFLKDDWARISHYMCKKLEKQGKTLDPDKVIKWLEENVPMFWEVPCSPNRIIDKFKGDFEI